MPIRCCNGCVPPKRTPTCHSDCPDYIREDTENKARLEADYKRRSIKAGLMDQRERGVRKAAKGKRKCRSESE